MKKQLLSDSSFITHHSALAFTQLASFEKSSDALAGFGRLEALELGFGFVLEHAFEARRDRKSTRLNSSHANISYAGFCLKKKHTPRTHQVTGTPNTAAVSGTPTPSHIGFGRWALLPRPYTLAVPRLTRARSTGSSVAVRN